MAKKCKICKQPFTPRFKTTQPTCENYECIISHAKDVKLNQYSKTIKKNSTARKVKKKTFKEHLQDEVNKLSRKIDAYFGYGCIDCHRPLDFNKSNAVHGAHRHNVGGHENIRFNLNNIHAATLFCNKYSTEHKTGYDVGLVERYGQEYFDMVMGLDLEYPVLKLNELEIKEALKITRKINREFDQMIKGNDVDGSMARSYFNEMIGIYK